MTSSTCTRHVASAVVAAAVLAGCGQTPTTAQVTVGAATYRVEVAQSVEAQRQGLAGRDELPAGTGMLFELDGHRQQVWGAGM